MIRTVVLAVIIGFGATGLAQAQGPPDACGPKGDLSAELSNNVSADSRCFEVRMYTARPEADGKGGINELHQRFREGEVGIFEKHGAEIVAVWQRLDNPNTLVWMLAYRDRAHRDEVWAGFREDPEWDALVAKYPAPLEGVEVFWMSASDYSATK